MLGLNDRVAIREPSQKSVTSRSTRKAKDVRAKGDGESDAKSNGKGDAKLEPKPDAAQKPAADTEPARSAAVGPP
jgi:hypothetical protein